MNNINLEAKFDVITTGAHGSQILQLTNKEHDEFQKVNQCIAELRKGLLDTGNLMYYETEEDKVKIENAGGLKKIQQTYYEIEMNLREKDKIFSKFCKNHQKPKTIHSITTKDAYNKLNSVYFNHNLTEELVIEFKQLYINKYILDPKIDALYGELNIMQFLQNPQDTEKLFHRQKFTPLEITTLKKLAATATFKEKSEEMKQLEHSKNESNILFLKFCKRFEVKELQIKNEPVLSQSTFLQK